MRGATMLSCLVSVGLLAGLPQLGTAQECGHYTLCFQEYAHKVWPLTSQGGSDQPHEPCMYCGMDPKYGACHFFCDLTEQEKSSLQLALDAAARKDLSTVLRVARSTGGRVVIDLTGTSVAVLSCTRRAVLARVAISLPDLVVHWLDLGLLGPPSEEWGLQWILSDT